ncbi:hypothetical protein RFI_01399 [Reticulomyxa filosa]|uniref:Uncharacterized protein n=1 Tax=Reticulomyxa filosa TaxID=46433 RepID=X6PC72_RETFI|nr:hypothetical protein RFI_01399 [Reticulomyxa filosa]|eukprot:ETO35664.1 hypothetical protein RFI_01399 [Reticulomyxa filosa]
MHMTYDPKQPNNEKDIILQILKGKHINKEIMEATREKVSFIFIMDEKYFYDRNSMMHLWPFSKGQMSNYIEKFANMKFKSKSNDWIAKQYEETLTNYPNLQKKWSKNHFFFKSF